MLHCQVFLRTINGQPEWRGTVERDGKTVWSGSWRKDKFQAAQDAENAAKAITLRVSSGPGFSAGRSGSAWPLRPKNIIY